MKIYSIYILFIEFSQKLSMILFEWFIFFYFFIIYIHKHIYFYIIYNNDINYLSTLISTFQPENEIFLSTPRLSWKKGVLIKKKRVFKGNFMREWHLDHCTVHSVGRSIHRSSSQSVSRWVRKQGNRLRRMIGSRHFDIEISNHRFLVANKRL